jgi:pilus assembly protein Flp/PilA
MQFIMTALVRAQNAVFAARDDEIALGDRAHNVWLAMHDEEGQTLVEYALIITVVALGVLGALYFLRDRIKTLFSNAGSSIG